MHSRSTAYAERVAISESGPRAEIRALRQRAAAERQRAARADSLVTTYEARGALPPESLHPLWGRLTDLHRQIEERHLVAASITELYASRLEKSLDRADGATRPTLIAVVAASLGTPSATAALCGPRYAPAVVASSDATARAAYDLETTMAEGPAIDAVAGTSVAIAGPALLDRWPRYGSAVAGLGVRAVAAVPLGPPGTHLGALCAYRAEPVIGCIRVAATERMAEVLTEMILFGIGVPGFPPGGAVPRVFDEADYQDVVHQAIGMVSVQCGCELDVAKDLLVARAFAVGAPVERIAAQVVRGEIDLR
jgi:hypothetical protein